MNTIENFAAKVAALSPLLIGVLAVNVDNVTGARVHIRPDDFLRQFDKFQRRNFLDMEELSARVNGVEFFALVEKEAAAYDRRNAAAHQEFRREALDGDLISKARAGS